jgi:hypothetical protein
MLDGALIESTARTRCPAAENVAIGLYDWPCTAISLESLIYTRQHIHERLPAPFLPTSPRNSPARSRKRCPGEREHLVTFEMLFI